MNNDFRACLKWTLLVGLCLTLVYTYYPVIREGQDVGFETVEEQMPTDDETAAAAQAAADDEAPPVLPVEEEGVATVADETMVADDTTVPESMPMEAPPVATMPMEAPPAAPMLTPPAVPMAAPPAAPMLTPPAAPMVAPPAAPMVAPPAVPMATPDLTDLGVQPTQEAPPLPPLMWDVAKDPSRAACDSYTEDLLPFEATANRPRSELLEVGILSNCKMSQGGTSLGLLKNQWACYGSGCPIPSSKLGNKLASN